MNVRAFGKATEASIRFFQDRIGFFLPDDYISFLMGYNGGVFQDTRFFVPGLKKVIQLHTLYGVQVDKNFDLESWNDEYQGDLLANSIVIGHDYGGAGFIVLIVKDENEGVYFWDHTFAFEQSNEEHNTYFIADNFQEFINQLK